MDVLHKMFDFIISAGEFLVFTVILKVIIAHWLADHIIAYSKVWMSQTERNLAIWTHYQDRAFGHGHNSESVLDCGQGKCQVFAG